MTQTKEISLQFKELSDPKKNISLSAQIKELESKSGRKAAEITDEEIFQITRKIAPLSPLISEMRK